MATQMMRVDTPLIDDLRILASIERQPMNTLLSKIAADALTQRLNAALACEVAARCPGNNKSPAEGTV